MKSNKLTGLSIHKLRLGLALFFLALAVPMAVLVFQSYSQLKWEAFHRHRQLAEEFASRMDKRLGNMVRAEEARSFTEYQFLNVAGDPASNFVQRSPLSEYPVRSEIPGVIGYFQVDAVGQLTTPLLSAAGFAMAQYGINRDEYTQRANLQGAIERILQDNKLVRTVKREDSADRDAVTKKQAQPAASSVEPVLKSLIQEEVASSPIVGDSMEEDKTFETQLAFDELKDSRLEKTRAQKKAPQAIGSVESLNLDTPFASKLNEAGKSIAKEERQAELGSRAKRKEKVALPEFEQRMFEQQKLEQHAFEQQVEEPQFAGSPPAEQESIQQRSGRKNNKVQDVGAGLRVSMFQSEVDAFEFSMLDSGHFVMFRNVWREKSRYIQGMIIDANVFLREVLEPSFRNTLLAQMSNVLAAYQDSVLLAVNGQQQGRYYTSADELQGALLYQTSLSAPMNTISLIFTINRLPAGPGGQVIIGLSLSVLFVMCLGFYLMYRLGVGQINLARQQQDFVSAVSHELKTPLTSIRMYGEMLREGWADEAKRRTYYDYIYHESERLTRLISNVLQLARMTRNDLQVELKEIAVSELLDSIRSKIDSQIERAGFTSSVECSESAKAARITVDADYFTQIIINLVDNAVKFSKKAENLRIDISCETQSNNDIVFSVRDYGPGIAKDQMKKIFKLFYRMENELTRETIGTGIGLALVQQLTTAMNGKIDVLNREPGAEFRVVFPSSGST